MTKIKKYVERIEEELNDSKYYIEKALWYKAEGNTERYTTYKNMSLDELDHAMALHEIALEDIKELEKVYPDIPDNMMKAWEDSHNNFIEKTAWIKQMQNM